MRLLKPSGCTLLLLFVCASTLACPPDPNNAALLYYQAFISFPSNYREMSLPLEPLPSGGIEPSRVIRDYLTTCHDVLDFTKAAAEQRECDWGLRYALGGKVKMPHIKEMRHLCYHVMAQAQVFAADKEYQRALENCLIIHKIAQHIGDDSMIALLFSNAIHGLANKAVRQILNLTPANPTMLAWLEKELVLVSQRPCLRDALLSEEQLKLGNMNLNNAFLVNIAEECRDGFKESAKSRVMFQGKLTEADQAFLDSMRAYKFQSIPIFIEGNRIYYIETMAALRTISEEAVPFDEKQSKLIHLQEKIDADGQEHPHAIFTSTFEMSLNAGRHARIVQLQSGDNLLKVAIHLYKVEAETGDLPDELPSGLPKNPFNNKSFEYTKTEEGFVLRMETKGLHSDKPVNFKFTVR